jgi:hypothetical protein
MSFSQTAACFMSGMPTSMTSARRTASAVSIDLETLLLRGGGGLGTLVQAHDDVESAVAGGSSHGNVPGTEAEDGEGLVLEETEIGVLVGVHFGHGMVFGGKGLLDGLLEAAGQGDGAGGGRSRGCRTG